LGEVEFKVEYVCEVVTAMELNTNIMRENPTPLQLEAIEKETRSFVCPMCDAHLQFRLAIKVNGVQPTLSGDEMAARDGRDPLRNSANLAKQQLAQENIEFLKVSKELGIFDAFNQAVETAQIGLPGDAPVNREGYFLKWFQRASKQNAPSFALKQCLNGSSGGNLTLWGFQNVSAILQDGLFRMFIPRQLLHGNDLKELVMEKGEIVTKRAVDLTYWVRTKYGYVEKSGEFANELRKHSIGAFSV